VQLPENASHNQVVICQENGDRYRIDLYDTSEVSEDMVFGIGITRTFRHLSRPRICILRVTGIREYFNPLDPQQFYNGIINSLFITSFSISPFVSVAFSLA
jgi:hypothetical protein